MQEALIIAWRLTITPPLIYFIDEINPKYTNNNNKNNSDKFLWFIFSLNWIRTKNTKINWGKRDSYHAHSHRKLRQMSSTEISLIEFIFSSNYFDICSLYDFWCLQRDEWHILGRNEHLKGRHVMYCIYIIFVCIPLW